MFPTPTTSWSPRIGSPKKVIEDDSSSSDDRFDSSRGSHAINR